MDIDIKRNGSRSSTKGNADWFTGSVRVDPLFQAPDPGRVSGGQVTFEPGARTAWHTHPLCRPRMGAARGRIDRGDPRRRRRLVSAGSEALARRFAHDGHDAYRHPGILQRKERRLDGEGGQRPVPKVRCPRCTAETTMNFVRLPTPTTCTSPRSGRTGGHTGHRRGYGPLAVDGALYVRGYNGQNSRWYGAAAQQKAGRIVAAGLTKEVAFEPVDGPILDSIDEAYRSKYRGNRYLEPMISARARSATIRIVPRQAGVRS
ncbi:hypothetical protein ACVWXN_000404 [Bradyrhizobium sp. i1.4.4]